MRTRRNEKVTPERSGFTLIELMAVVAIIGILASLFLPALSLAKETAWSTVCKNSLRQRMLGIQIYATDFARYPLGLFEAKAHLGETSSWGYCPTAERDPRCMDSCCGPMSAFGSDYLYNSQGAASDWFSTSLLDKPELKVALGLGGFSRRTERDKWVSTRLPEARVVAPASMIAVTHMVAAPMFLSRPLGFGGPGFYEHPFLNGGPLHRAGENAVFADGHAESEDSDDIPTTTNAYGYLVFKPDVAHARRWNHDNQPHPESWQKN